MKFTEANLEKASTELLGNGLYVADIALCCAYGKAIFLIRCYVFLILISFSIYEIFEVRITASIHKNWMH